MRRWLLLVASLVLVGCGQAVMTPKVIVIPVDEQTVLDGKVLLWINANADGREKPTPSVPDNGPAKCLCGGTGRSGDGLGPCACQPNCTCKKASSEAAETVLPETGKESSGADQGVSETAETVVPESGKESSEPDPGVPMPEDVPEPAVSSPAPASEAESTEFVEDTDGENLDRLTKVVEDLTDNQVKIVSKIEILEQRIQALEKPVAAASKPDAPKVSGFTESQAKSVKLVMVSQDSCQPCKRMIDNVLPELERRGYLVAKANAGWVGQDGTESQIQVIKIRDLAATSEAAEALKWAKGKSTPFLCYFVDGVLRRTAQGEWTADSIEKSIRELSEAAGKPQTSTGGFSDVYRSVVSTTGRLPVVTTVWGRIDLETYQRNCNCQMCQGIRSLQSQYRKSRTVPVVQAIAAVQAPSTEAMTGDVIAALKLSADDVFADIGCGDGRILIAAVQASGCTAVGIEIDPKQAKLARHRVAEAGLSDRITILTGDARKFDPGQYNVTAAVAYLYPQLLGELKPILSRVPRLVTPFHQVPGMGMIQLGEIWLKTDSSVDGINEI
jgi:hypothetical protein